MHDKYGVVVNDEGCHSIWWQGRDVPAGWYPTGTAGTRQECLERIEELWTDMRPMSRRTVADRVAPVPNTDEIEEEQR